MRISSLALLALSLALTGCSLSPTATSSTSAAVSIRGMVHGGQQPISGAQVYLFAAATGGYGQPSVSLLTSVPGSTTLDSISTDPTYNDYYVTTGGDGSFSITGDYACTTGQQVYLYAVGGNPGSGLNSAAGLLAALGNCPGGTFSSSTFVFMDEVSTVATAYSIAGFATDAVHVSSSGTALAKTGIANAFANVPNLESLSTGTALTTTPAGNGTVPQQLIDTLADILAACINSTGPGSTGCSTLFTNAKSGGSTGTTATDAATAAINIAHNPGANVAALYGSPTPTSPFNPTLPAQPNDFTLGINYTGGGLSGPQTVAIDAGGNAWVANFIGNSVVELSPTGAILSGTGGYTVGGIVRPHGIAIDQSGNAWVANATANSLTELTNAGALPAGEPTGGFTGGGLNGPNSVAIDGKGNVWVSSPAQDGVSKFSSAGAALSPGGGYAYSSLYSPEGIALDGTGNVWIANYGSANLIVLNNSGTPVTSATGYLGGGTSSPFTVALDSAGNAWAADAGNNSLSEYTNSGTPLSPPSVGYTGGGLNANQIVALDGAGNAWSSGFQQTANVAEFSSSGVAITGSHGYQGGTIDAPYGIAIDGAGNVWISNYLGNSMTELIGAGTPVVTPICAALPTTFSVGGISNLATRP